MSDEPGTPSVGGEAASEEVHYSGPGQAVAVVDLYEGFLQSHDRLQAAIGEQVHPKAFFALFETLNWAVTLQDRLANTRGVAWIPAGSGGLIAGLRFARNRVHHQWADAVEFRDGIPFPIPFPIAFFRWHWRQAEVLPKPADPRHNDAAGERAYIEWLAGHSIDESLRDVAAVFSANFSASTAVE